MREPCAIYSRARSYEIICVAQGRGREWERATVCVMIWRYMYFFFLHFCPPFFPCPDHHALNFSEFSPAPFPARGGGPPPPGGPNSPTYSFTCERCTFHMCSWTRPRVPPLWPRSQTSARACTRVRFKLRPARPWWCLRSFDEITNGPICAGSHKPTPI